MVVHKNVKDLLDHMPPQEREWRVLGLDVGDKYIGIALSDLRAVIASPYTYYERKSFQKDADYFKKIIDEFAIKLIVVGLPLNMDGSISAQAERTLSYIEKIHNHLATHINTHILLWDERFSTQAVERAIQEHHHATRKRHSPKKRGDAIDRLAATYILQGALDYMKRVRHLD